MKDKPLVDVSEKVVLGCHEGAGYFYRNITYLFLAEDKSPGKKFFSWST